MFGFCISLCFWCLASCGFGFGVLRVWLLGGFDAVVGFGYIWVFSWFALCVGLHIAILFNILACGFGLLLWFLTWVLFGFELMVIYFVNGV